MKVKGIISEDFVNYKKPCMTIMFPYCTFKCGTEHCQNSSLANSKNIEIDIDKIVSNYINNPITESICMQGLEPMDSWDVLLMLISKLREVCNDDIVIYTGYNREEIVDKILILSTFKNIIIKFGRYIPNQEPHYDEILGIYLASDNQYAERIS